jgi:hypothetical protein
MFKVQTNHCYLNSPALWSTHVYGDQQTSKASSLLTSADGIEIFLNDKAFSECQDKFYRVRPLLDCIRRRCQELEVEQHVAVDEQVISFKGRHSCQPIKPMGINKLCAM